VSAVSLDRPGLADVDLEYSAFGRTIAGGRAFAFEAENHKHSGFFLFGYTGQRYDHERGLYHMEGRRV